MKLQNLILSALTIFGLSSIGNSQSFQSTIYQPGIDFNHYSIETNTGGEYILAGTIFHPSGLTDIHVLKLDPTGNLIWEVFIDESDDDRALDVLVDPNDEIVVTGYISPVGVNEPELYVVKLTPSGAFITDRTIQQFHASVGTNVIFSMATHTYIVGGFYSEPLSFPIVGNEAMVVEFDMSLNYVAHNQFSSADMEHTSINDITEVPGGYFLTGSVGMTAGYPTGEQGVLALKIDLGLNMLANVSFEATNSEHCGVSSVYDMGSDELYLMSNNSVVHNPQISIIQNVSSTPNLAGEYYLELDPSYGSYNAAGFELKQCSWDPNALIAAGYFRTYDDGSGSITNAVPWIVMFDRTNGAQHAGYIWPVPSPNFHAHGGGILSTFSGEHPYIFNQEILTERGDGAGYVLVGPREIAGDFGIDVMTTNFMNTTPCFRTLRYNAITWTSNAISAGDNFTGVLRPNRNAPVNTLNSSHDVYCREMAEERTPLLTDDVIVVKDINATSNSGPVTVDPSDFKVSPNPFTSNFTVELVGENLNGQLVVLNALGQVVYVSDRIEGEYYRGEINLEGFEQGIYILKFRDGANELMKKIVKL